MCAQRYHRPQRVLDIKFIDNVAHLTHEERYNRGKNNKLNFSGHGGRANVSGEVKNYNCGKIRIAWRILKKNTKGEAKSKLTL